MLAHGVKQPLEGLRFSRLDQAAIRVSQQGHALNTAANERSSLNTQLQARTYTPHAAPFSLHGETWRGNQKCQAIYERGHSSSNAKMLSRPGCNAACTGKWESYGNAVNSLDGSRPRTHVRDVLLTLVGKLPLPG